MIEIRHAWGEERVYFLDSSGHMRRLPTSWTNVVEDPFVIVAAGRAPLRLEELLELVDLLDRLESGSV
jgi:hypothetical protein